LNVESGFFFTFGGEKTQYQVVSFPDSKSTTVRVFPIAPFEVVCLVFEDTGFIEKDKGINLLPDGVSVFG